MSGGGAVLFLPMFSFTAPRSGRSDARRPIGITMGITNKARTNKTRHPHEAGRRCYPFAWAAAASAAFARFMGFSGERFHCARHSRDG